RLRGTKVVLRGKPELALIDSQPSGEGIGSRQIEHLAAVVAALSQSQPPIPRNVAGDGRVAVGGGKLVVQKPAARNQCDVSLGVNYRAAFIIQRATVSERNVISQTPQPRVFADRQPARRTVHNDIPRKRVCAGS